jgi:hypothetical protein
MEKTDTKRTNMLKVKVKVKSSLCFLFNWAPRHEGVLGEWRYSSTHSLTSALDGGEWLASRSGCFTPKERTPGTHWIGGWVDTRAFLNAVVKWKIPSTRRKSNHRTPIVQPVAQSYTYWAITVPGQICCQIKSDYGWEWDFSLSHRVQTESGTHPASNPMCT